MTSPYQNAYFLLSAADVKQLPPDEGIEVAIVGRSNSGKSSVLNCLTQNKKLARVSKTPGRTQLVNMFVIDEKRRIADLPGYGYAKVPLAIKNQWQKTVNTYIEKRKSLVGLVVVMDIRHPMQPLDLTLLAFCDHYQLPVHILLNKADKLSNNMIAKTLQKVNKDLKNYAHLVTVQTFSALRKIGLDVLQKQLAKWYEL